MSDQDQTPVSDTQPLRKPTIPKDAAVLVVEDNVSNFVSDRPYVGVFGNSLRVENFGV
jgi:hypothetical protein